MNNTRCTRQKYVAYLLALLFNLAFTVYALVESRGTALHRYKPSQDLPWHSIQVNIVIPTLLTVGLLAVIAAMVVFYSDHLHGVVIPLWVMLNIAVVFQAYASYGDDHLTFDIQVLLAVIVMGGSAVALKVLKPTKRMLYAGLLLLIVLAVCTAVFAEDENGAKLTFCGFMPAEATKAAVPYIYLCSLPYLSGEKIDKAYRSLFGLTIACLPLIYMFGCNDYASGLINAAIGCAMLITHRPKVGIPVTALGLSVCPIIVKLSARLQTRVDMVWDVLEDFTNDAFWQIQTHQVGVISSGILGRGVGTPEYTRLLYLPECGNDFSLLASAAVFGLSIALVFIGMAVVLALHSVFAQDGGLYNQLARRVGVTALMGSLYVAVGSQLSMFPFMGVCVPFLSAGGSAQFTNALLIGLIISTFLPNTVGRELRRRFNRRNKKGVIQYE